MQAFNFFKACFSLFQQWFEKSLAMHEFLYNLLRWLKYYVLMQQIYGDVKKVFS